MIVSEAYKFVFVSTPKCATNTMYQVLMDYFSGIRQPLGWHANAVPARYAAWFTWTIVRNPYARAVSLWWSTVMDPQKKRVAAADVGTTDFATFLRFMMTRPRILRRIFLGISQSEWLRPVRLDRIVKLETLQADLEALPFWKLGTPVLCINASHGEYADWWTYIDDETGPLIREWAAEDFERFGYDLACPLYAELEAARG